MGPSIDSLKIDDVSGTPTEFLRRQRSHLRLAIGGLTALVMGLGVFAEIAARLPPPALLRRDFLTVLSLSFENNLPSWWLSTLLALCGGALALCASTTGEDRWHWWLASTGAFVLSFDESAGIHMAIAAMYESTTGIFGLGFLLPALALTAAILRLSLPWLRRLPLRSRQLFIAASSLYLLGALLLQLLLSLWARGSGERSLIFTAIEILQRPLEILGASLLLVALIDHLSGNHNDLQRSLPADSARTP